MNARNAMVVAALLAADARAADGLATIEREQQEIFRRVAPAVVLISAGDWMGSGFFVSSEG